METETRDAEALNPYAAPLADDGEMFRSQHAGERGLSDGVRRYPLASRWHRWAARFVDTFFGVVCSFGAALAVGVAHGIGIVRGTPLFENEAQIQIASTVAMAIGSLPIAVLQWHLTALRGATIGKRLLGLRVVHANGQPVSWQRTVLLREVVPYVVGLIPGVNILLFLDVLPIFSQERMCLHDMAVDTRVVQVGRDPQHWTPGAIAVSRWDEHIPR
jgi:uncharacterized RDD family membrane protein YckC